MCDMAEPWLVHMCCTAYGRCGCIAPYVPNTPRSTRALRHSTAQRTAACVLANRNMHGPHMTTSRAQVGVCLTHKLHTQLSHSECGVGHLLPKPACNLFDKLLTPQPPYTPQAAAPP